MHTSRLAAALVSALALLSAPALASGPSAEQLARGEEVMKSFCLSCHGVPDSKAGRVPLPSRLRPEVWGDAEQAYAHIGALGRINSQMNQPFTRSDEDRRALAAWLAKTAQENHEPWWGVAVTYAPLVLAVAAALGFLAWMRRRSAG